jgi:hypothetical protein
MPERHQLPRPDDPDRLQVDPSVVHGAEQSDPLAQQHRNDVDQDLVDQTLAKGLAGDAGPPCPGDRHFPNATSSTTKTGWTGGSHLSK